MNIKQQCNHPVRPAGQHAVMFSLGMLVSQLQDMAIDSSPSIGSHSRQHEQIAQRSAQLQHTCAVRHPHTGQNTSLSPPAIRGRLEQMLHKDLHLVQMHSLQLGNPFSPTAVNGRSPLYFHGPFINSDYVLLRSALFNEL